MLNILNLMGPKEPRGVLYLDQISPNLPIIITKIKSGLYGRIILLTHEPTGENLIFKLFDLPLSKTSLETFINESNFKLNINSVVKIHGTCSVIYNSNFFNRSHSTSILQYANAIIMDYYPGFTLNKIKPSDFGSSGELTDDLLIPLFRECVRTLAELHSQDIAHRDIKPENIIFNPESKKITIIDLGFAVRSRTVSGLKGSPIYLSWEIYNILNLNGRPDRINLNFNNLIFTLETLKSSDIWALGITFYYLIYGTEPFDGDSAEEIAGNILNHRRIPLIDLRSGLEKIHSLIDETLKLPSSRPSAIDLLDLIENL